jgi:hypothetical protein
MSVITACSKNGKIAIAADTGYNFNSHQLNSDDLVQGGSKIISNVHIGFVGYHYGQQIFEHMRDKKPVKDFDWEVTRALSLFTLLHDIHKITRENYFLNTSAEDSPTEDGQLQGLLINKFGIFSFNYAREAFKHKNFFATGCATSSL